MGGGGEVTRSGLLRKVEVTLELYATSLPVPGHLGNATGRLMSGRGSPGLGHRIEELFATGLLMISHLEFAIGRPTPSRGHWFDDVL